MRFEKWTALGNDYLILEADELPWELTRGAGPADLRPALRRRLRRHPAALAQRRPRAWSPSCGSSTPTARRRSCRATARARRSSTCAAAAGPSRGHVHDRHRGRAGDADDHLRAHLHGRDGPGLDDLEGLPGGPRGRSRHAQRRRAGVGLPARLDRQPAVRDRGRRRAGGARPGRDRARDRAPRAVPEPHQRLLLARGDGDSAVRARIFERGVGETLSSGTGASGAAVAAHLRGAGEPDHGRASTAASSRSRSPADLEVRLTGLGRAVCSRASCRRELRRGARRSLDAVGSPRPMAR